MHDQVGAELERALVRRRGERVVDGDERITASMSITCRNGLVGLSTQISRVSSLTARSIAARSVWSTRSYSRPHRRMTLSTSLYVPP
jgi:hypothetical protein